MTRISPLAVVFDFDLTLVDSLAGFVECHAYASRGLGFDPPAAAAVARTIGTPLPEVFHLLHGSEPEGELEYLSLYQKRADEVMTRLTVFLDGAPETIRLLREAGIPLGIVSQKRRYRVEEVLRRERLLDAFEAIIGADDAPAFKPDPRGLLLAIERLGAAPPDALYVGDTVIDAETACRAGVPFVAVLTGYARREEIEAQAPLAVLASVADLLVFLGLA